MKFNPLRIAELAEDSECVLRRIEIGCRNHFIYTFWTYFPLAVSLQAFLSTRDRIILSLTNSVVCLDATEVAFALTEKERRSCGGLLGSPNSQTCGLVSSFVCGALGGRLVGEVGVLVLVFISPCLGEQMLVSLYLFATR